MKKLFLFMMLLLASMFATTSTLQAQSEFTLKGQDIPMYIDGDSVIIYDGIIRMHNDTLLLVETLGGFYINEKGKDIHVIDKRDYVNSKFGYIVYEIPQEYVFWVKYGGVDGKIQFFHYTNFKSYTSIQY